jgi:hypothetical protein
VVIVLQVVFCALDLVSLHFFLSGLIAFSALCYVYSMSSSIIWL